MPWGLLLVFLVVSMLFCCMGFYKFVYFMSVGYGLSVAALGVAYFVVLATQGYGWSVLTLVQCALFVVYGVRLSGFLLVRELKNLNYRKVLAEATGEGGSPMPFFVKLVMWVCMGALYVLETCPVFFRAYNGLAAEVALPLVGIVISVAGIVLEAAADAQKSAQKAQNPDMVATQGLFKMCRCPNYLGEILFWTGVIVSALDALSGVGQWVMALLGYVLIVVVMLNGAQRLDRRQEGRYGADPAYRAYADHTPIIFPGVPLYHIGSYKG